MTSEINSPAANAELVRAGFQAFNTGDVGECLAHIAPDLIINLASWEYAAYADEFLARCRELGMGLVLGGSVLTERDQADLLGRGAVRTADFVTGTRPLDQVAEAFALASSGQHVKVLVTVGER